MYINKIEIQNIRSISQLEMTFDNNHAGWHVLIGDNGTGKSTVIKSISLGLIGPERFKGLRQSLESWIRQNIRHGSIALSILQDLRYDKVQAGIPPANDKLINRFLVSPVGFVNKNGEVTEFVTTLSEQLY